jgi:hypothetical protein
MTVDASPFRHVGRLDEADGCRKNVDRASVRAVSRPPIRRGGA